jgi:hypothetical protein
MMLLDYLPSIIGETEKLDRVLDVGGSAAALNTATHILDLVAPAGGTLDPRRPKREACFVLHDICKKPWPFVDGYFDYAFCSHTLEDVRDPIGACEELMRVARRGYIEVPSRLRESFYGKRFMRLRALLGRPLRVGYGHHRWFCERQGEGLVFMAKTLTAVHSTDFIVSRDELGRDLTPEESWIGFFWNGTFPVQERILIDPGHIEADLSSFKAHVLQQAPARSPLAPSP